MKRVLLIVGILLILLGGIWILQGFNVLPVGFMAGQMQWALYGTALALVGIGLVIFGRRTRKASAAPDEAIKGR